MAKHKQANGEYKIEKGVPIQKFISDGQSSLGIAIRKLEVGDSFVIPNGTMPGNSAHNYARFAGVKITQRKQADGSIRVWRIA